MISVKYQGDQPTQGSALATGYDVKASEQVVIEPSSVGKVIVTTRIQPTWDVFAFMLPRSSICNKKGLILLNSVGVIDPDYTGVLIYNFWNLSDSAVTIEAGERVGQLVFCKRHEAHFTECSFEETKRGNNGFGSSGKF